MSESIEGREPAADGPESRTGPESVPGAASGSASGAGDSFVSGQPKAASSSGSGGGLFGSIIRGLGPVVRSVIRSTTRSTSARRSVLQLRYHDGGANRWGSVGVTYARKGSRITVVSASTASWWHHVRSGGKVQVRIRQTWFDGFARVVSRDEETWTRAVNLFVTARGAAAARRAGLAVPDRTHSGTGSTTASTTSGSGPVVVWIELDRTP